MKGNVEIRGSGTLKSILQLLRIVFSKRKNNYKMIREIIKDIPEIYFILMFYYILYAKNDIEEEELIKLISETSEESQLC